MPLSGFFKNSSRKVIYGTRGGEPTDLFKKVRYRRIWMWAVFLTAFVSIIPLIVMTIANYVEYQKALKEEIMQPIQRIVSINKRSLEYSLDERKYALHFIINEKSFEELQDRKELDLLLKNLKESFGGFVDLGLIDHTGKQVSYIGPYKLEGVNYAGEEWFFKVQSRGEYISNVYLGFRKTPHFVIAIKHDKGNGDFYVLRATIDTDILDKHVSSFEKKFSTDAFIVNSAGILQTPSISGKKVLEKSAFPIPSPFPDTGVSEISDLNGRPHVLGYAYIEGTPFIFIITNSIPSAMQNWFSLRGRLLGFLVASIIVILALTMSVSSVLVSKIREADIRHDRALHQIEYSAKMASLGRLAAGVAHEINNPLAIINEKAGLLQDFVVRADDFPRKEKSIKLLDSIISSVERCSAITHRLLGFARHFEVNKESIDLAVLMNEVLSFLEKEAAFRNITIKQQVRENIPMIQSDRGQLQQVFLNIVNNAFAAVGNEGQVDIFIEQKTPDAVTVTVSDNGVGIDEKNIDSIFEPFFSTKDHGTGLGLSITYGIVRKLKGEITVESEKGQGSSFTVTLPLKTE